MEGELKDEMTDSHISRCPNCREAVSEMQQENDLLRALLDAIPAPDLTGRVMARVEKQGHIDILYNILSYLVAAGTGLVIVQAYRFLPGLLDFEFRPVAIIEILSAANSLALFIGETLKSAAAEIFRGAPLIPPVVLVLALLLINLIGKRRPSDV